MLLFPFALSPLAASARTLPFDSDPFVTHDTSAFRAIAARRAEQKALHEEVLVLKAQLKQAGMTPGAAVPSSATKGGPTPPEGSPVADGALLRELEEKKAELKNATVRLERLKNVFNTSVQVRRDEGEGG